MTNAGLLRKAIINGFEIVMFACPKGFPVASVFYLTSFDLSTQKKIQKENKLCYVR